MTDCPAANTLVDLLVASSTPKRRRRSACTSLGVESCLEVLDRLSDDPELENWIALG